MCLACIAGLHELCDAPTENEGGDDFSCCCWTESVPGNIAGPVLEPVPEPERSTLGQIFFDALNGGESSSTRRRAEKDGEELQDVLSTGRKRAAQAKPITDGTICEWARLKNAGGGVEPIVGCSGNVLYKERGKYARHHGPDKNVLNNSPENLHLICPTCHNRWHTLNDPFYGDGTGDSRPPAGRTWLPNRPSLSHDDQTIATPAEILNNEIFWSTEKKARVQDERADESA